MQLKDLLTGVLCICVFGCVDQERQAIRNLNEDHYVIEVIEGTNGGYGFQIRQNGRLKIHHPQIPSKSVRIAFTSKKHAARVALAIVKQLKSKELPPMITHAELEEFSMIVANR